MKRKDTADPVRILWTRWVDPLLAAVREHKDRGWLADLDSVETPGQLGVYRGPFLAGPAGLIPLDEINCPSRQFNLWVGHASFPLTRRVFDAAAAVPGVEVLRVWTRYRLWLGVGKAFDEENVKRRVLQAATKAAGLSDSDHDGRIRKSGIRPGDEAALDALSRTAAARWRHWAILENAEGRFEVVGDDDPGVFAVRMSEAPRGSCRIRRRGDSAENEAGEPGKDDRGQA